MRIFVSIAAIIDVLVLMFLAVSTYIPGMWG